jgi:hypothetical protein
MPHGGNFDGDLLVDAEKALIKFLWQQRIEDD